MVESRGIEPRLSGSQPLVLPQHFPLMVLRAGFAPATPGFSGPCSTGLSYLSMAHLVGVEPTSRAFGVLAATVAQVHGAIGRVRTDDPDMASREFTTSLQLHGSGGRGRTYATAFRGLVSTINAPECDYLVVKVMGITPVILWSRWVESNHQPLGSRPRMQPLHFTLMVVAVGFEPTGGWV